jgi:hypothetical protein
VKTVTLRKGQLWDSSDGRRLKVVEWSYFGEWVLVRNIISHRCTYIDLHRFLAGKAYKFVREEANA